MYEKKHKTDKRHGKRKKFRHYAADQMLNPIPSHAQADKNFCCKL